MDKKLRITSIIAFALAIPSLIVVDWYFKGFGILIMFILGTIGLVLDQVVRMNYPEKAVEPITSYRKNRLLNIVSLILFVQSPMALIYGRRAYGNLGIIFMLLMIAFGILFNQIAKMQFHYTIKE